MGDQQYTGLFAGQNAKIERTERQVDDISERLSRIEQAVVRIEQQSNILYERSSSVRQNALPQLLATMALMFICIIIASPVLISSIRERIFGENFAVWYTYLLALVAAFSLMAFASLVFSNYRRLR